MDVVDIDVIRQAVGLACRAPSLHNSQPWRWVADGPVLQLFADPARIGRSTDSTGREVIISCGAVLDHLRVAMAAAGWHANVDRFPNPDNLGHLASVDFTPEEFVTDAQRARAEAIRRRRTDRLSLAAPPQWDSFEPALRDTVDRSLAVLDVVPDDLRPQLAEVSRLTEELRREDSSYHAELQWWTMHSLGPIPPSALVSEQRGGAAGCESTLSDEWAERTAGRDRPGSLENPRLIHLRRQPGVRVGMRRNVVDRVAGVHDRRLGDVHIDAHDRGHRRARVSPSVNRKVRDATGFDSCGRRSRDRESATTHPRRSLTEVLEIRR